MLVQRAPFLRLLTYAAAMSLSGTRQESRGTPSSQTAVFALCLGNGIQWYDFALYGAFATIIGPLFFPSEDPATVMLAAFATYGTALIIRPVGALLFADRSRSGQPWR